MINKKQTKDEFDGIRKELNKLSEKHKGNLHFTGTFFIFDKNGDVTNDVIFAYGYKDTIQIDLKELLKAVKKEKEEFINW